MLEIIKIVGIIFIITDGIIMYLLIHGADKLTTPYEQQIEDAEQTRYLKEWRK